MLEGKTVLVTGAGGSIGSVLCERIVRLGAKRLKALSLTESGLYNVNRALRKLGADTEIEPILGSVTNEHTVRRAVEGVDVVIHAAAHKHIPLCEENPVEAVLNNVFGTEKLLDASIEAGVKRFLLISTDKAVKPASVMGATKRVAEMLVKSRMQESQIVITVARFGNVLDSAGSVLPLWREQIAAGGPVTVTDPRCERYFMRIADACELVLAVLDMAPGIYVFDMGRPVRIVELATELIKAMGARCSIEFTGLRPGEKLTEELYNGERRPTHRPTVFSVDDDEAAGLDLLGELDFFASAGDAQHTVKTLMAIAAPR